MTLDEIKQILEMMREHELAEFELERDGVTLRLRKQGAAQWPASMPPVPPMPYQPAPAAVPPAPPAVEAAPVLTATNEDLDLAIVKSPIVGTFYRSSEPGSKPFVETGQAVQYGERLFAIKPVAG